ncbi:ribokinase [Sporosarcina sp. P16a]|uniref:ribokinase n=1 Tax=unclassified Sporosarcina TaxID=2647733 RepID=UPI000C165218|nr:MULTISPECIES: ribokinase [unclassified Sporosarcina]PIC68088.1 ribokinase [Sporosarcina sp. P16a]PIC94397.1 ribokinase [Sporosarcina sp. P25]
MITVIGNANIDLIAQADKFPLQGETVRGKDFQTAPGGKGANQAVACAKLGHKVQLIGTTGTDSFGEMIVANLRKQQVDTSYITQVEGPSGVAVILLTEGDNRIISIPGANHALSVERMKELKSIIGASQLVMMQLELPVDTVWYVLKLCKDLEVPVMMDPAPSTSFQMEYMPYVRYLTPNETECAQLFGTSIEETVTNYPNQLLVTLGKDGVCYHNNEEIVFVPGVPAQVVDTTGAGDTFNGALASRLVQGSDLQSAVEFANVAASLSVGKFGAQGGMPTMLEVVKKAENLANENK